MDVTTPAPGRSLQDCQVGQSIFVVEQGRLAIVTALRDVPRDTNKIEPRGLGRIVFPTGAMVLPPERSIGESDLIDDFNNRGRLSLLYIALYLLGWIAIGAPDDIDTAGNGSVSWFSPHQGR